MIYTVKNGILHDGDGCRSATFAEQHFAAALEAKDAEIARLTEALAAQTKQSAYPCSPHCAGYLREQGLRAVLEDIAEFCSGDKSKLGAIERLICIRNNAAAAREQRVKP